MPGIVIARFVIERDPERDYQIVESDGNRAQELVDEAWALLDLVGQPRPGSSDKLHAWIGPIGSREPHYVRVIVERLSGGELRFHQLWYASGDLPTRPACIPWGASSEVPQRPAGWPDDIDRVISLAKTAAETAGSRQARVHPRADPLSYCDALASAFGAALGPQITWITTVTDRPVPVHLRLVVDATVDEPGFSATPVSPQPANPRQLAPPRIDQRSRTKPRRSSRSAIVLLIVALVLGGVIGFVIRGPGHPPLAIDQPPAPSTGPAVAATPRSLPPPPEAGQPDPAQEELRSQLLASYDAVLKLRDFMDQPGLAKDADQTQIRETVVMTDLLDFGSVDKQKFSNADIRKLLDLFEELLDLHPDHEREANRTPPAADGG